MEPLGRILLHHDGTGSLAELPTILHLFLVGLTLELLPSGKHVSCILQLDRVLVEHGQLRKDHRLWHDLSQERTRYMIRLDNVRLGEL